MPCTLKRLCHARHYPPRTQYILLPRARCQPDRKDRSVRRSAGHSSRRTGMQPQSCALDDRREGHMPSPSPSRLARESVTFHVVRSLGFAKRASTRPTYRSCSSASRLLLQQCSTSFFEGATDVFQDLFIFQRLIHLVESVDETDVGGDGVPILKREALAFGIRSERICEHHPCTGESIGARSEVLSTAHSENSSTLTSSRFSGGETDIPGTTRRTSRVFRAGRPCSRLR